MPRAPMSEQNAPAVTPTSKFDVAFALAAFVVAVCFGVIVGAAVGCVTGGAGGVTAGLGWCCGRVAIGDWFWLARGGRLAATAGPPCSCEDWQAEVPARITTAARTDIAPAMLRTATTLLPLSFLHLVAYQAPMPIRRCRRSGTVTGKWLLGAGSTGIDLAGLFFRCVSVRCRTAAGLGPRQPSDATLRGKLSARRGVRQQQARKVAQLLESVDS